MARWPETAAGSESTARSDKGSIKGPGRSTVVLVRMQDGSSMPDDTELFLRKANATVRSRIRW